MKFITKILFISTTQGDTTYGKRQKNIEVADRAQGTASGGAETAKIRIDV